jgi:hypothetical protein
VLTDSRDTPPRLIRFRDFAEFGLAPECPLAMEFADSHDLQLRREEIFEGSMHQGL